VEQEQMVKTLKRQIRRSRLGYVFGQFVDHDLDLEDTPLTTADISIVVPTDPVFPPNTVIQMTRDVRNPKTNTIINTTAGTSTCPSCTDQISPRQLPCGTVMER
jgi:hypothetical protein